MNKKLFFGMFAAATMLFATSCSNDEMEGLKGNESVVSFTLEQPGISTRAYSDGLKATNLTYAVYETESGTKVDDGVINGAFSGKQASVTFTLEKDKTYDFIFWADAYGDAETSPYDFNADAKTLTVSYTNVVSNDEDRDAFYAVRTSLTVPEGSVTETITLTRPFAQLNIGSIGNDVIGFTPAKSKVSVSAVGTVLNLESGAVTETEKVDFEVAEFSQNEEFPVEGVDNYYSMNYLLIGKDKELVTVDFTLLDANDVENSRSFEQIPVRANYRTNIYGPVGNILSNSATFTVTIDERYDEPSSDAIITDIRMGNKSYETLAEALAEAKDGAVIELGAGAYELSADAKGKTLSFVGTGTPDCTIIKQVDAGSYEGECDYSLDGSTVTFENLTIETTNEQRYPYPGFARCHGTYKNCIINGVYTTYSDGDADEFVHKFENCTFNVKDDKYNLKTWGANASFEKCTFNCDGKAVLVYCNGGESTVTFNNCTFNDNEGLVDEKKAAIETGDDFGKCTYTININDCTVKGFDNTEVKPTNWGGTNAGTNVWGNKNMMPATNLNVFINGTEVY